MTSVIKNPKDFWTGAIYVAFGGIAFWMALDFGMGTASKMGPGYFPIVLASLLMLIGAISLVMSFLKPGPPIGGFAVKAAVLVLGGVVLFGFLISRAGLLIALPVMVLCAAAASEKFRFEWKAVLGLFALTAFCALVFVKGLGVPMPLIGRWFGV